MFKIAWRHQNKQNSLVLKLKFVILFSQLIEHHFVVQECFVHFGLHTLALNLGIK